MCYITRNSTLKISKFRTRRSRFWIFDRLDRMILQSGSSQIVFKISGETNRLCRIFKNTYFSTFSWKQTKNVYKTVKINPCGFDRTYYVYFSKHFSRNHLILTLWPRCFENFLLTIESELTEKTFLKFYAVGSYRRFNLFWMNLNLIWYDITLNSILIQFYVRFLITG